MIRLEKKFLLRYPPPVKGKIFDTRFGLIHVLTGKNFLWRATSPPPPSKGKNFWHQIWLDRWLDWKKKFCQGTPPPPQNSKKLVWLHSRRYASCVHAGGLSCSEYCWSVLTVITMNCYCLAGLFLLLSVLLVFMLLVLLIDWLWQCLVYLHSTVWTCVLHSIALLWHHSAFQNWYLNKPYMKSC